MPTISMGSTEFLIHYFPLFGQPFDKEKLEKSPFNKIAIIEKQTNFKRINFYRTSDKP